MGASASNLANVLGNSSYESKSIHHIRLNQKASYVQTIEEFITSQKWKLIVPGGSQRNVNSNTNESSSSSSDSTMASTSTQMFDLSSKQTYLISRKRPLNAKEIERGDFDVVVRHPRQHSTTSSSSMEPMDIAWVNKCGIRLDNKHMFVEHHGYKLDRMFDEHDDNEVLVRELVQPIVNSLWERARGKRIEELSQQESASNGGTARKSVCILAYGATGSGKTYTMNSLSEAAVRLLLERIAAESNGATCLRMSCMEISRDTAFDMLHDAQQLQQKQPQAVPTDNSSDSDSDSGRREVVVRDNEKGETVLQNCSEEHLQSVESYFSIMSSVKLIRATRKTGVHDASSRSHLITRLRLTNSNDTADSLQLFLVDLAGSEWAQDQAHHDSNLIADAKFINSSLLTLKQCIKCRLLLEQQKLSQPPFRESKLTRILRNCLSGSSSVVIISCIAPSSADTEHSMATLMNTSYKLLTEDDDNAERSREEHSINGQYFMTSNVLQVIGETAEGAADVQRSDKYDMAVADWTSAEVCEWFVDAFQNGLLSYGEAPMDDISTTDQVSAVLSAKKWVKLRLVSTDSIGLGFTMGTDSPCPVVSKVMNKGYIKMLNNANLVKPQYQLVRINGKKFATYEMYTDALKWQLKTFKEQLAKLREYDEKRTKFMTKDMCILRQYVLHGVAPPAGEVETESATEQNGEKVDDSEPIDPGDYRIELIFHKTCESLKSAGVCPKPPTMPQVPRIFTGESRTGDIWSGKELVNFYYFGDAADAAAPRKHSDQAAAESRLTSVCNGDKYLARRVYLQLKSLVERSSSS